MSDWFSMTTRVMGAYIDHPHSRWAEAIGLQSGRDRPLVSVGAGAQLGPGRPGSEGRGRTPFLAIGPSLNAPSQCKSLERTRSVGKIAVISCPRNAMN